MICINEVCLLFSVQHNDINTCPESERSVIILFLMPSSVNEIVVLTCKLIRVRFHTIVLSQEHVFPMPFYYDLGMLISFDLC